MHRPRSGSHVPAPGEVLLLENLRYHAEEEKNDPEFSKKLAALCDVYVNDAFGSAHRAHASTVGMIAFVHAGCRRPADGAGAEISDHGDQNPQRPCVAILGGAKVSDKIEVIENLVKVVDKLLIGGAMAYTFLQVAGEGIGKSLVEDDKLDLAKQFCAEPATSSCCRWITWWPPNSRRRRERSGRYACRTARWASTSAPGPSIICANIAGAKTIIWNGPMGVFEKPPFDKGTVALAKAVAGSGAVRVVGGGDSEKAIKSAGVADKISHVSTGGGASLFPGGTTPRSKGTGTLARR